MNGQDLSPVFPHGGNDNDHSNGSFYGDSRLTKYRVWSHDAAIRVFTLASTVGNGSIPVAMIAFGLLGEFIKGDLLLPVSGLVLSGLGLTAFTIFSGDRHDTEKCRPGI